MSLLDVAFFGTCVRCRYILSPFSPHSTQSKRSFKSSHTTVVMFPLAEMRLQGVSFFSSAWDFVPPLCPFTLCSTIRTIPQIQFVHCNWSYITQFNCRDTHSNQLSIMATPSLLRGVKNTGLFRNGNIINFVSQRFVLTHRDPSQNRESVLRESIIHLTHWDPSHNRGPLHSFVTWSTIEFIGILPETEYAYLPQIPFPTANLLNKNLLYRLGSPPVNTEVFLSLPIFFGKSMCQLRSIP